MVCCMCTMWTESYFDLFGAQGSKAFCSGGDQALRDSDGYVDFDSFGRLNVLDLQVRYAFL